MENNSTTNKTKKQVFFEYVEAFVCVVLWLTPVVLGVYLFNEFQNINRMASSIIWSEDAGLKLMFSEIRCLIAEASYSIIAIITVFLFCIGLLVMIRTKNLYKDE